MSNLPHTSAFAPDTTTRLTAETLPMVEMLGLRVVDAGVERTLDWLCDRLLAGQRTRVAFLNAHCANVAARDPDYQAALAEADAVLPDGSGVAVAARLHGRRLAANLNGTDLGPALCGRLVEHGLSVFLLGARPGVAEAAARRLQALHPGLRIAGTADGFFDRRDTAAVIETINASGADVLLTALGVPEQDVFLARHAERLAPRLTLGVGALFDFLAERVSRAPRALRAAGLEWTWRLWQEPRRLAGRYLLGNPAFLVRAARDALAPRAYPAAKRAMDIVGAGTGLLLLSPVLLAAMAAIRLTSPGGALLSQTRVGQDGTPFRLWKLRSMYIDAEARRAALMQQNQHGTAGVTFKMRNDPRVTPVGRLLRRSSLDELPQLWNVLVGDMSLVGPRPPLPQEVARYTAHQWRRLEAKPGLTCLWQVSGRADLPFDRQVALDIEYLRRRSLREDLRIMLATVPAVLTARGAY